MAKQTFTTGQVLTAAQVTSLQATALGGGATTAKTTSYVLVAADAGTVVQMNSASATTITVNTALFAAGDTVTIQSVGSGVCTVTAGTATVSTSATLALKQYDAGTLYFNTTSAAFFFAVDAADGMANVLTTTGDIIYSSSGTTAARLGIGSASQVLAVSGGIPAWTTASAGGFVFLRRVSFTSVATTTTSFDTVFSSTYKAYKIVVEQIENSSGTINLLFQWRVGSTTQNAASYYANAAGINAAGTTVVLNDAGQTSAKLVEMAAGGYVNLGEILATKCDGTSQGPMFNTNFYSQSRQLAYTGGGSYNVAISTDGFILSVSSGNITGKVAVYGLAAS